MKSRFLENVNQLFGIEEKVEIVDKADSPYNYTVRLVYSYSKEFPYEVTAYNPNKDDLWVGYFNDLSKAKETYEKALNNDFKNVKYNASLKLGGSSEFPTQRSKVIRRSIYT